MHDISRQSERAVKVAVDEGFLLEHKTFFSRLSAVVAVPAKHLAQSYSGPSVCVPLLGILTL